MARDPHCDGRPEATSFTASERLALIRTAMAVLQRWNVGDEIARAILGGLPAVIFRRWQRNNINAIDSDVAYRLSLLLKIHAGLPSRYSDPDRSVAWINRPNTLFAHQSPLAIMTREVASIDRVLRYLVAARSPW